MPVLVDKDTRVIIQGITGSQGTFHTEAMLEYGTKIVAGMTPGKGGEEVHGIPVYDSVTQAKKDHDITASVIFVPAPFAGDAAMEAIDADLNPVVLITEHVPVKDEIRVIHAAKKKGITIIGPNTPGIITPGDKQKLGIMPGHVFSSGEVGLMSRSGTLTYEIAAGMTQAGIGISTAIGLGGDPCVGLTPAEGVRLFKDDKKTKALVLVGEIGGDAEERAAAYVKENYDRPVVAFIAGRTAPPGKRMGHAGAIISGSSGTAAAKIKAFNNADVPVAERPSDVAKLLKEVM
ncbi:MAG: succinyl-CoA synthetase, NAD(P)-binding, alpha subunit [Candidatus Thorarchaeota archaeon]|nr:MAG: succinyl-CoA synthetase, NAD(P)-binding, alpha subunit [Candidatus Thorarchaeota archaeon]